MHGAHRGARRPPRHASCVGTTELTYHGRDARPHAAVAAGDDGRARSRSRSACGVDVRTPIDELRARRATSTACRGRTTRAPASSCSSCTRRRPRPSCGSPVFVIDYPKEVSPLARRPPRGARPGRAVRGDRRRPRARATRFSELTDPDEQRARFEDQAAAQGRRRRRGDGRRRGLPPRPRVRPAADRSASASASTAW